MCLPKEGRLLFIKKQWSVTISTESYVARTRRLQLLYPQRDGIKNSDSARYLIEACPLKVFIIWQHKISESR